MKAKERLLCCFQGGELAGRQEKKVEAEWPEHIRIPKRLEAKLSQQGFGKRDLLRI